MSLLNARIIQFPVIILPTTLQTSTKTFASPVTIPTGPVSTANPPTAIGRAGGGTPCIVTAYASSLAIASCSSMILSDISALASSWIDHSRLKTGPSCFCWRDHAYRISKMLSLDYYLFLKEMFGITKSDSFNPTAISGTVVTIVGQSGHVIDGNGQAYWDGQEYYHYYYYYYCSVTSLLQLDIQGAFDTVNHTRLLYTLQ